MRELRFKGLRFFRGEGADEAIAIKTSSLSWCQVDYENLERWLNEIIEFSLSPNVNKVKIFCSKQGYGCDIEVIAGSIFLIQRYWKWGGRWSYQPAEPIDFPTALRILEIHRDYNPYAKVYLHQLPPRK